MELKQGVVVHIGKAKYSGNIPDEIASKIGIKKEKKDKPSK